MEGQLRPGLRAGDDEEEEEEVAMVVVLLLTVVLAEGVEEHEVVAGADGVCTSFADESTLRCIFSTLTAGVRLEKTVTEMKRATRRMLSIRNSEKKHGKQQMWPERTKHIYYHASFIKS